MTMLKMCNGIIEIEGTVKGDVYRKDQCGQHVQAFPRLIKHEPSQSQKKQRRAYRMALAYIRKESTVEFASLWQQYANNHAKPNRKGEMITLTWWQMFMKINLVRLRNDLEVLHYPPE